MATDGGDTPDDERRFIDYSVALVEGIDRALGGWVERCVLSRCEDAGIDATDEVRGGVAKAISDCRSEIVPKLRTLVDSDIDDQRTTPLAVVREAVTFPTSLLVELGVEPSCRDEFAERMFPDDPFGLSPASLADIAPELGDAALAWGAAKAHVHLTRRRAGRPR